MRGCVLYKKNAGKSGQSLVSPDPPLQDLHHTGPVLSPARLQKKKHAERAASGASRQATFRKHLLFSDCARQRICQRSESAEDQRSFNPILGEQPVIQALDQPTCKLKQLRNTIIKAASCKPFNPAKRQHGQHGMRAGEVSRNTHASSKGSQQVGGC